MGVNGEQASCVKKLWYQVWEQIRIRKFKMFDITIDFSICFPKCTAFSLYVPLFRSCVYGFFMFVGWVCSRGLLAMKEDPEQQTPPDAAPGSTPSINATFTSRTAGSRSSVSEVVQTYPDLTEIALLCSNATGLLDIEEAHLLFQRQEWRPNIESGMPTLRRFIRPSDWDRIEKMIQNVVNLPPADIDIERRCYFGHPMPLSYSRWVSKLFIIQYHFYQPSTSRKCCKIHKTGQWDETRSHPFLDAFFILWWCSNSTT